MIIIKNEMQIYDQEMKLERINDLSKNLFKYLKKLITDLENFEENGMKQKRKEILDEYFQFSKRNYVDLIENNITEIRRFLNELKKENSTN